MTKLKFLNYLLIGILIFSIIHSCQSCAGNREEPIVVKQVEFCTDVYIDKAYEAKYSVVQGHFEYEGMQMYIDNGSSGYYHKKYNLTAGQKIPMKVIIKYVKEKRNCCNSVIVIQVEDMNVDAYL